MNRLQPGLPRRPLQLWRPTCSAPPGTALWPLSRPPPANGGGRLRSPTVADELHTPGLPGSL